MAIKREQKISILLGLTATSVVAFLSLIGVITPVSNIILDRFQRWSVTNEITVSDRIIHVDVDDNALNQVGRWPWSREVLADLLNVLRIAGARTVAIDLLFDDPQSLVPAGVTLSRDPGGIEGGVGDMLPTGQVEVIVPDRQFAEAIAAHGNVILSMYGLTDSDAEDRNRRLQTASRHGLSNAREALYELMIADFTADDTELEPLWRQNAKAAIAAAGNPRIDQIAAGARQDAADHLAAHAIEQAPPGTIRTFEQLCEATKLDPGQLSPADRRMLIMSLQRQLALTAVANHSPPMPKTLWGQTPRVTNLEPPYYLMGEAAKSIAVVRREVDQDGSVRRLPLLYENNGRAIPHLGFATAVDALGLDLAKVSRTGRTWNFPAANGTVYQVPVDAMGRMILHWSPSDADWDHAERHITAARVVQIAREAAAIRSNLAGERARLIAVILAVKGAVTAGDGSRQLTADTLQQIAVVDAWHAARLDDLGAVMNGADPVTPTSQSAAEEISSNESLLALSDQMATLFDQTWSSYNSQPPETPEEVRQYAQCLALRNDETGLNLVPDPRIAIAANERIAAGLRVLMDDMRARIRGRIVFVGHTATAEGDVVPTAIHPSLPGVIAHSTVLNTFLQNRFIHQPGVLVELLIILTLGWSVALITARREIVRAAVIVLAAVMLYLMVMGFIVSKLMDVQLAEVASPPIAMLASAVTVAYYRWWTTEQQRREIRAQFGQYTSPALANRIADDPAAGELLTRVDQRVVTCFFSDLKGFTTIAERTDAEITRAVLNIYLDRMSEVLDKHQALINKFMGDGIFAFINSSVLPREKHEHEACEAALDSIAALQALKHEHREGEVGTLMQELSVRIGLASGKAGVGDFGSSRKKDYTVIGDVANLAARLEPANKVFGTSILIAGATRDAVAEHYEFRYLAELQVKGKKKTVPVYELMGRKGSVDAAELEWAARFAAGVELYKARKWDDCIEHFSRMLARRFDETGADTYINACEEKKAFPPNDEWCGALELKEK